MLKLGLGLSLSSIRPQGVWSPDDEESLEAWYKNATGIVLNVSDVEVWADSSANSNDMRQTTASEQPRYGSGTLTFDSGNTENLQTTGQVTLDGAFTIGFKANPTAFNNVILADNTSSNEFIKYVTTSRLAIKIGGTTKNLNLDSGTFGDDYIVITRNGSDLITLHQNGAAQSGTVTLAGDCLIDAIGVRAVDLNPYDGTVEEVQLYSSSSSALTDNVNDRLAGI